ncbi:MAG TPA: lysophospholipid acyltransferase family protein [Quisquiliibacterium sp.]|nr:lysophospholipid acyltransferase family protein [Quisquiliibacterium sp.]
MVGLFQLLGRLPLPLLQAAGAVLGCAVFVLSGAYRRKVLANLAAAGLPHTLAWSCAAHAGRMVGELPWIWFRPRDQILARVFCDDLSAYEAAERAGRGVLLMTPHLGCFEVSARHYASRAPITVLFRPPRQAVLAPLYAAARNQDAMRSEPANLSGVRALMRALRRGEAVGLLPDQAPGQGEGRWSPFFGRPAYTMTLPGRLAQSSGAAVVLVACERLPRGRGWRLHLVPMAEVPEPDALNRALERLILRWPEQYLWGYNRYKRPAGAEAPPADGSPDTAASAGGDPR